MLKQHAWIWSFCSDFAEQVVTGRQRLDNFTKRGIHMIPVGIDDRIVQYAGGVFRDKSALIAWLLPVVVGYFLRQAKVLHLSQLQAEVGVRPNCFLKLNWLHEGECLVPYLHTEDLQYT